MFCVWFCMILYEVVWKCWEVVWKCWEVVWKCWDLDLEKIKVLESCMKMLGFGLWKYKDVGKLYESVGIWRVTSPGPWRSNGEPHS